MFAAAKWLMEGDFDEAEGRYRSFAAKAANVGDPNGVHSAALHEFLVLWESGRVVELFEKTRKAIAKYPNVPGWRAILAYVYFEDGDIAKAELEYRTVRDADIRSYGRRFDWIPTATLGLAQTCHALGDRKYAEDLYGYLEPYTGREGIAGLGAMAVGCIDRYLGLLAETFGATDRAIAHYHAAIDFDTKFGARPWVARAQYDLARVFHLSGRAAEAVALCRNLVDSAKDLGMQNVAFKGESLLRQASRAK